MKVLLLNGSPHEKGCTHTALCEVANTLEREGVSAEIFWAGDRPVQDCVDCGACRTLHACAFEQDGVNQFLVKAKAADGFVFGTPVYFSHPAGSIQSFLDRVQGFLCTQTGRGGCRCAAGRKCRFSGCAEQVFHAGADAGGFFFLLERGVRANAR